MYGKSGFNCFTVLTTALDKAIIVTGRGDPYVCETSRLPHFLDSRLTDGGEIVSRTFPLPPERFLVLISVRV
jgi:hypothetical protein